MTQIQDGSGKGYWAKVDHYNRVHVYSTLKPEISEVSLNNERAFSITTPAITFNSTNEHPLLWLKNKNPDLTLFFSSIIYSYNGGDTSHNRIAIKKVYSNPPEPTGNYEEITPINLSISSSITPLMEAYSWNGSGDGIDIDLSNSKNLSTSLISNGSTVFNEIEAVNLRYNASILFSFEPEEIGKAAISIKIYFNSITIT